MRASAKIEAVEALWQDRMPHTRHGTVFDDLLFVEAVAREASNDVLGLDQPRHPLGYLARVVIDGPSQRLLRTGVYFDDDTVLVRGPLGERLVLGPGLGDDVAYLASLEACDCLAGALRWLLGEDDGIIRVVSFPPIRLLSGRPLPVWPAT
jgi:hypothetical protein